MGRRIPIIRICDKDGAVIHSFLLHPNESIDVELTDYILAKKPKRLMCDG